MQFRNSKEENWCNSFQIGLDLSTTSFVMSMSSILNLPFIIFYGGLSDYLVTKRNIRKLTCRRILHGIGKPLEWSLDENAWLHRYSFVIGTVGPAIIILGLVIAQCNVPAVITLLVSYGSLNTASACSFTISIIDFAPNFAGIEDLIIIDCKHIFYLGTIMGIIGIGNLGGGLSPIITSQLVTTVRNDSFINFLIIL